MFAVGDKIVYPMHGAGVVQAIEQHELAGENVDYLVMMILLSAAASGRSKPARRNMEQAL